jgi:hypothetical protein
VDGTAVGIAVVGVCVGAADGPEVGFALVGSPVGSLDGAADGLDVGAASQAGATDVSPTSVSVYDTFAIGADTSKNRTSGQMRRSGIVGTVDAFAPVEKFHAALKSVVEETREL